MANPDHTNRALKILGTGQLLPMVRVEILPYCMGPQPGDQGWWQGKFCVGEGRTMIIQSSKAFLVLSSDTLLPESATIVRD